MAVAIVMSRGRTKYLQTAPQTSPKPKARGSVAETIEVFYGVGTVVSLYDFIPCWEWDDVSKQFVERSCTFIAGENFQLAANVIQHTGDVEGTVYVDFRYYDESSGVWISILAEDSGRPAPFAVEASPGDYIGLLLLEDIENFTLPIIGFAGSPPSPENYGKVVIVPGKYRTYDLGKTHYFALKAWGEDEEEPTLPPPV